MRNYEMMFIVKTGQEDAETVKVAEEIQKIAKANKAEISDFKDLGLKKLAYPINKEINGHYFLMNFKADKDALQELDRKVILNEQVIRHMIVKVED